MKRFRVSRKQKGNGFTVKISSIYQTSDKRYRIQLLVAKGLQMYVYDTQGFLRRGEVIFPSFERDR
jgi:hypothetical protein